LRDLAVFRTQSIEDCDEEYRMTAVPGSTEKRCSTLSIVDLMNKTCGKPTAIGSIWKSKLLSNGGWVVDVVDSAVVTATEVEFITEVADSMECVEGAHPTKPTKSATRLTTM
jgi:hypothetical protein